MPVAGLACVGLGRRGHPTSLDLAGEPSRDLVQRALQVEPPNQRWVSIFTYVPTRHDCVYVAFVIVAC